MKINRILTSAALMFAVFVGGQERSAAQDVSVTFPDTATPSTMDRQRDTLSIDFPDEDIRTVLRNVADLFELNLVVPDTLVGRTSVKLRDVTWRQIFQVVLAPAGFTYIEDGNIIKVVSTDSLLQEPVVTEVFILNYARANEIQPTIASLVDAAAGGRIQVDQRSNALVITERPTQFNRIRPIIEQLDRATDQVMIETKFIEVTNRDLSNIGVNWASLGGYQVSAGPFQREWELTNQQARQQGFGTTSQSGSDTTGVTGSTEDTSTTTTGSTGTTTGTLSESSTTTTTDNTTTSSSLTGSADPADDFSTTGFEGISQTEGESTTETLSESLSSSISESVGSATTVMSNLVTTAASEAVNSLLNIANNRDQGRSTTAVFNAAQFNLILSLLQTQNDTKLVSNPTIVTLDNTEATINIGEEFPIPAYTYNQERGTFEVSGFDYKPIGIILRVTPQVNNRGFINLKIVPEVSSRAGTTSFGGDGGAQLPIIATRKTETNIAIKDGFTMGIGGLIENQTIDSETKVPLLGDIPGLGRLFRSNTKDFQQRNLLVFITARTLNADGADFRDVFDPRMVREMKLREDELPGYRSNMPFFAPEGN